MRTAILLTAIFAVSGCGVAAQFKNMSGSNIDTIHDSSGRLILADTPRMWAQFVQLTDIDIRDELAGGTHWGGYKNANDAWVAGLKKMPEHRENPQKYVDYVIQQRRAAGLPELVGYP